MKKGKIGCLIYLSESIFVRRINAHKIKNLTFRCNIFILFYKLLIPGYDN